MDLGYVSWIGDYADRDSTLTTILYEAGAVPFVRTNIPQTLMVCLLSLHPRNLTHDIYSGLRLLTMSLGGL